MADANTNRARQLIYNTDITLFYRCWTTSTCNLIILFLFIFPLIILIFRSLIEILRKHLKRRPFFKIFC